MLKMVMITYNETLDADIMELMERIGARNYTKLTGAFGRGRSSGTHLGDDIWPGLNNVIYVSCVPEKALNLMSGIREMRKTLSGDGIKAFMMPVDDET